MASAMGTRETASRSARRLLALASGGVLGLMATPALAATDAATGVNLPYAALDTAQDAAQAPPPLIVPPLIVPPVVAAPVAPTPAPAAGTMPAATSAPDATPATTPHPAKRGSDQDIVVSAKNKAPPGDPLIGINLKSYAVVQAADKALIGPAAMAYKKHLPSPLRKALHNVLVNLREPPVAFAFLVEHKFGKAFETVGRFGINSTLGIAGIMDIAKRKPFNLPWRPNGIADALGFYGVPNGPYFFLPMIGPTTLRDLIGTTIDRVGFPALYADELRGPAYGLTVSVIGGLDDRVMIDPQVREFREHAPDPYAAMRTFYLTRRQAEIDALHGKPPLKDKISDYDMPGGAKPAVAPAVTPPVAPPVILATPDGAAPVSSPPATPAPDAPTVTPAPTAPAATPADTPKP
jgi:phospholipid-binding lipoprotein MlaA